MSTNTLDSLSMYDLTAGLPEQILAAAKNARGKTKLPEKQDIENIVVLGMGGSGISGEVIQAAAGPFMSVPITVVKSYTIPSFLSENSLVFAISFSGNTEETIEASIEAASMGAKMVCITSGGQLAELASSWNATLIDLPSDIAQPRAAIGHMSIPPLVVLEDIGFFPGASEWIDLAVDQLRIRRDELISDKTPAAKLAKKLARKIPLVYSSGAIGAAAAQRWKTQINENAKTAAFYGLNPELCHNEIAGWGQNGDVTRQLINVVNLRHDSEHPQVQKRFEIIQEVMTEAVAGIDQVWAQGEGDLAQLFDLILFGDFVSLHMAYEEDIDPGPIPVLSEIKDRLRKG